MPELKASPRSAVLGKIADIIQSLRDRANDYEVKDWVPLLGGSSIGDLLIGKAPEEINEWSYGNAPMRVVGGGTGSYIPQTKLGRQQQIADAMFLAQMTPTGGLTRAVKSIPAALRHGAEEFAHASAAANPAVIKTKGGNWLTGSVEDALGRLKRTLANPEAITPEMLASNNPAINREYTRRVNDKTLNNWIEGPLTKYVKRDMATEGDPVRRLAEQGILHFDPRNEITEGTLNRAADMRQATGNRVTGTSTNPLARAWETITDASIGGAPVSDWKANAKPEVLDKMPWLSKLPDSEMVYERSNPNMTGSLNFPHLTDELANALNPESGLPRNLLLTPEDFQQMGMERAVRHVHNINEWRAAQKAAADLQRANNAATVLFKEYAENNPRGLRWVELKQPDLPEGWVEDITNVGRMKGYKDPEGKFTIHDPRRQALQDALKYEGETMGHCASRYCQDVLEGKSRIYSLRDAKGQPHVTIETAPHSYNQVPQADIAEEAMRRARAELGPNADYEEVSNLAESLLPDVERDPRFAGERIVQIKGKANLAPKEEYLPFVQDFVRSGKWSDVGDLRNAGMVEFSPRRQTIPQGLTGRTPMGYSFESLGIPEGYYTESELLDRLKNWQNSLPEKDRGFAEGGLITNYQRPLPFHTQNGIISNIER